MPGSIRRDDLAAYLEVYLDAARDRDYGPNGIQVEGREEVRRVITAVSACEELSQRARGLAADAILVHHGLYWDGAPALLKGLMLRRVRPLIEGEISLFAYHLPLDRHGELGNNILAPKPSVSRRSGASRRTGVSRSASAAASRSRSPSASWRSAAPRSTARSRWSSAPAKPAASARSASSVAAPSATSTPRSTPAATPSSPARSPNG
jgi:hypothetical protein